MANASAKKAAAARGAAAQTYLPVVASINLLYLFLQFIYHKDSVTKYNICMAAVLVSLSGFAYKGILEDHANTTSNGEALKGGLSLDLLGLVVLVQFGSFVSSYFYWLLGLVPIVGGYKLYSTFKGGKEAIGAFMPHSNEKKGDEVDNEEATAKRQKRAERRRQKWN